MFRLLTRAELTTAVSLLLGLIAAALVAILVAGSWTWPIITLTVVSLIALIALETSRRRKEQPAKHAKPGLHDPLVFRHRIRQGTAVFVPIVVVIGICIWFVKDRTENPAANYRITVQADPDQLTTMPQLQAGVGNYVTALPIGKVPDPPGNRDTCDGRYTWAHNAPINGIDAERTLFLVTITAVHRPAFVNGAAIHDDNPATPALTSTLLACPGAGGPTPPDLLTLDLDSGTKEFFPAGGETPGTLNVHITPGETSTLIVSGDATTSYVRWRLILGLYDGDQQTAVSIGPDGAVFGQPDEHPGQRSFQTTGDLTAHPFRFHGGTWTTGR